MMRNVLIIGAGGIGALLSTHVARAYAFSNPEAWPLTLTIMDGDAVEERNLPHQPYAVKDVGKSKVDALIHQLENVGVADDFTQMRLVGLSENFSAKTDLSDYDLVVVAVDREEPRRLVHENAKAWLDLRCRGAGFLLWSHLDDIRVLNMFPALADGESASCQLEGAVETGNIQFGFAEAASHGAQWVIQWLRGEQVPPGRTYSIHMGDLPLPIVQEEEE
jgi:hypothetical protein